VNVWICLLWFVAGTVLKQGNIWTGRLSIIALLSYTPMQQEETVSTLCVHHHSLSMFLCLSVAGVRVGMALV
jgi:hypothetical protein